MTTRNASQSPSALPTRPPAVCVLLPVHRDSETLETAFASMQAQTLRDWHCLLLLNGADDATTRRAHQLAAKEPRTTLHTLPEASLPKALNAGLAWAQQRGIGLCARMDADDWSFPHRLEMQTHAMQDASLAAIGSDWEVMDSTLTHVREVVRVPSDARESRWRLLLRNHFAHGSMVLRTSAVLAVGGYDESMRKAQDYDLWLRLTARRACIASVPAVLYRHREKDASRGAGVLEQARFASAAALRAWARLAFDAGDSGAGFLEAGLQKAGLQKDASLVDVLARVHAGELSARAGQAQVEVVLREAGPTREALMAWLLLGTQQGERSQHDFGSARASDDDACVRWIASRVRARAEALLPKPYLFPGGRLARRALTEHALHELLAGIVDDEPARVRSALSDAEGLQVLSLSEVPEGAHVLLATHAHAEQLWNASEPMRARGVNIERQTSERDEQAHAQRGVTLHA
jgi:hypothetical protein